jgi:3-dehydroquinate synthase
MSVVERVSVPVRAAGGRDYDVVIAPGLLSRVGTEATEAAPAVRRWVVVADATVAALFAPHVLRSFDEAGCAVDLLTFPAGERHKTRETWASLSDELLDLGVGRDGGIVALGGGVTGDLAGFVAATFMRGIPVVQVPTSIVAMVDSAVGGKTGVDTPKGKNLVGAFHPPARVVVDPAAVETLPRPQRAEGLAEAVKHGAIVDLEYMRQLASSSGELLAGRVEAVHAMVVRSVQIKAGVVSRDEREGGVREILNFGHTIGHALEAASNFGLSHGEAVAAGMVLEARLGEILGGTPEGTAWDLSKVLEAVELPVQPPEGLSPERVISFIRADKKARDGRPRIVLLGSLGSIWKDGDRWSHAVDASALRDLLDLA